MNWIGPQVPDDREPDLIGFGTFANGKIMPGNTVERRFAVRTQGRKAWRLIEQKGDAPLGLSSNLQMSKKLGSTSLDRRTRRAKAD